MGRTSKNIKLRIPEKPHKIKGFRSGSYQVATTISSRSRYDRFDSPPYISTVFRALRKCKKNRQERYEILKFDPAKALINQGFSAEETARANAHFECCTFDHSDNSPCLFSSGFLSRNLLENSLERKQERRQKIFDFEIFCVEEYQGESGGRNSQIPPKFRVSPVMTTSIPLHRICSANTDKKCKKWEPFRAAAVLNTVERLFAFYTAQSIITACRTEIKPGPEKRELSVAAGNFSGIFT